MFSSRVDATDYGVAGASRPSLLSLDEHRAEASLQRHLRHTVPANLFMSQSSLATSRIWKAEAMAGRRDSVGWMSDRLGWFSGEKTALFKYLSIVVALFSAYLITSGVGQVEPISTVTKAMWVVVATMFVLETVVTIAIRGKSFWKSKQNLFDLFATAINLGYIIIDFLDPLYFVTVVEEGGGGIREKSATDQIIVAAVRFIQITKVVLSANRIPSLQVLLVALVRTIWKSLLSIMLLVLIVMFLFVVIAINIFGELEPRHWSNFGRGLLTLFSFVTVDGWYDIQLDMDETIGKPSRIFTICFIIIGNFVLFNIFIGVTILNIQESNEEYYEKVEAEKEAILGYQKEIIINRQERDMLKLMKESRDQRDKNVNDLVDSINKKVKDDETVVRDDILLDPNWIEQYLELVERLDASALSLESTYRDLGSALCKYQEEELERKLGV